MALVALGLSLTAVGFALAANRAPTADSALAAEAQAILQANCASCHGPEHPAKGKFDYVLDRDKLVARQKLVPGKPFASPLFQRIAAGEMPPQAQKLRPGAKEVAILQRWIEIGAPTALAASRPADEAGRRSSVSAFLSDQAVLRFIQDDLQHVPARQRRYLRYFSLVHLHNAGRSSAEIQLYRHALAKLINSLSWHPRITLPTAIDPDQTIYRIDLRHYQWDARLWERLLSFYPFRLAGSAAELKAFAAATGTEVPMVKADWFVATAARPPLYYDLLQLPTNDRELERQLRVDVLRNLEEETALRAGFNDSGVSRNNRLIERHDVGYGAYWRSYDFSDNVEHQNLFEHPLGPVPGANAFVAAGGEVIFNLPNGLQAYLLVDGNGRRIDRAAIEIVSDPNRPERFVESGVSCMGCHVRGLLPKTDQVRAHVEKNPSAFTKEDLAAVKALYVPAPDFAAQVEADAQRYLRALAKLHLPEASPEPVLQASLRYDTVDLPLAAAELGLAVPEFTQRLGQCTNLLRTLGPLRVPGGTVSRQVFLTALPELLREFHRAETASASIPRAAGVETTGEVPAFTGHTGPILALALSSDGRLALSGSADKTLRLWDVATGRELRCFAGHTEEVLAVALSADGKRALSGGQDRTVRLWDLVSGRELRCFRGHTERVSSVALSADGRRILSGSWDQTLRWWDVESGQELARLVGHQGWVSSVALAPDGRHALSGGYDRTVRLWDLTNKREVRRLEGHGREVYAVAFSPDGQRILSGGNDRTVCLWDTAKGTELRRFAGAKDAVIRVSFSSDGQRVLAGSSRYQGTSPSVHVWDRVSGQELQRLGGTAASIWSIAFSADGSRSIAGGSDQVLRSWDLAK